MTYQKMTQGEKNELVKQYEPLVNKMIHQFFSKGVAQWDTIKSMAYEGLAIAINSYDSERSSMTFTQFAAFAIRNNILTCLDNEIRTVKLSNYAQKKAVEAGESLFNSVSMDTQMSHSDDDNRRPLEIRIGMYENEKFSDGDVFEYLYTRLEAQFSEKECVMFYKHFGLKGFDETKGKDIAKEFDVSEGLISQKVKKVVNWIRKDENLCEVLGNLVG